MDGDDVWVHSTGPDHHAEDDVKVEDDKNLERDKNENRWEDLLQRSE